MAEVSPRYRIGFDIGGTFTDFVLADADVGTIRLHKCLTTPEDPSVGVLGGLSDLLEAAELSLGDIGQLVHGTTLVTNAIIERRGSTVALLTTRGFRDTLEFGHEQRYDIHDLFLSFPPELVPRRLRIEVDERTSRDGDVIVPLNLEQARTAVSKLEDRARNLISDAGVIDGSIVVKRRAEMRLFGQMHDLTIPLPDEPLNATNTEEVRSEFAAEYTRRYTELYAGATIQILSWKVECASPASAPSFTLATRTAANPSVRKSRPAYFPEAGGFVDAAVYDRYALRPDDTIVGPAIIEEHESTTVLPPGDELTLDEQLNLRLRIDCASAIGVNVTSRTSLQDAVSQIESDPIGLEIMWSRLINITEECWETVIRTAFSLIIGEAQDFACEILDAKGNQLAHSPRAMPVFNISLPYAVNAMIERYPVETLEPGDILVTNDPWLCAGHLFDVALATPVFRDEQVVALMGMVGHITDIGGTKDSLNAREIYEEGLQIPPLKLYRAGVANQDLFELIRENVRNSDQVIGDLHALVAACRLGANRIIEKAYPFEPGLTRC